MTLTFPCALGKFVTDSGDFETGRFIGLQRYSTYLASVLKLGKNSGLATQASAHVSRCQSRISPRALQ